MSVLKDSVIALTLSTEVLRNMFYKIKSEQNVGNKKNNPQVHNIGFGLKARKLTSLETA